MGEHTRSPKEQVIGILLSILEKIVPLQQAVLATLGGTGIEARIWQGAGVAPHNGWLIERARKQGPRLIAKFPYRNVARLSDFSRSFANVNGKSHGIDFFHLDLCGVFEPNSKTFGSIIPLIMRSKGRCFAVTIADQRTSISVDNFDRSYDLLGSRVGTKEALQFFEAISAEQHALIPAGIGANADPVLGAQREFGFAVALLERMKKCKAEKLDRIERFLYFSNKSKYPFRMRTYFFHFSDRERGGRKSLNLDHALALWMASDLKLVTANEVRTIVVTPTSHTGKENVMPAQESNVIHAPVPQYSKLAELAKTAGGEFHTEFQAMLVKATLGYRVEAAMVEHMLTDPRNVTIPMARESANQKPGKTAERPVVEKDSKEDVAISIDLLLAFAKGNGAYVTAKKTAIEALGLTGRKFTKSRERKIGGKLAQTGANSDGKFRKNFVKRVSKVGFGLDTFADMAAAYSKLDGKEVTAEQLQKEAGAGK